MTICRKIGPNNSQRPYNATVESKGSGSKPTLVVTRISKPCCQCGRCTLIYNRLEVLGAVWNNFLPLLPSSACHSMYKTKKSIQSEKEWAKFWINYRFWKFWLLLEPGFEPDPLLLTIVRSLGVFRANFLASGHSVPGIASSKVKKLVRMWPRKMNHLLVLSNPDS